MTWSFINPFFTQGLLAGWGILKVYQNLIEKGAAILGFEQQFFVIFLMLFFIHLIFGISGGAIGFKFSQLVLRRYYSLPFCERSYDY